MNQICKDLRKVIEGHKQRTLSYLRQNSETVLEDLAEHGAIVSSAISKNLNELIAERKAVESLYNKLKNGKEEEEEIEPRLKNSA